MATPAPRRQPATAPVRPALRLVGGGPPRESRDRHERQLLARYLQEGDVRAREELVARLLPLARKLARRYQRPGEPLDDLVQVASVGLVKAIDRFALERSTAFSSFAVPTIVGELKRHFRDNGWAVHVPRGMQERVLLVDRTAATLSRRLGRAPAVAEIAAELEMPVDEVLEAREAAGAFTAMSLDAPRGGDAGDEPTFADSVGEDDDRLEKVVDRAAIAPALAALPDRDRQILSMRFVEDLTQQEIAERVGISQMHVSRLIRRSLDRLRAVAEANA